MVIFLFTVGWGAEFLSALGDKTHSYATEISKETQETN